MVLDANCWKIATDKLYVRTVLSLWDAEGSKRDVDNEHYEKSKPSDQSQEVGFYSPFSYFVHWDAKWLKLEMKMTIFWYRTPPTSAPLFFLSLSLFKKNWDRNIEWDNKILHHNKSFSLTFKQIYAMSISILSQS